MENNRKICKQCGNLEEHGVNRDKPDGLMGSRCKKCELIRRRAYLSGRRPPSPTPPEISFVRSYIQTTETLSVAMDEGSLIKLPRQEWHTLEAAMRKMIARIHAHTAFR